MSVDAGGGKLKHFKWPKAVKKVNKQTLTFNKKRKCRDELVKKSMGTRVGMEHVQEQPHVQLSTNHTHINIPTCGV